MVYLQAITECPSRADFTGVDLLWVTGINVLFCTKNSLWLALNTETIHMCLKVWIIFISHTIPLSAYGRLVWLVPSLPVLPAVPTFVPKSPSEANLKLLLLISMNLLVCRPWSSAHSYSLSLISQLIAHGDASIFHHSQARKTKRTHNPPIDAQLFFTSHFLLTDFLSVSPLLDRVPAIFLCHCLPPPPHSTAISQPLRFRTSPVGDENTQHLLLCQLAPLGRCKMPCCLSLYDPLFSSSVRCSFEWRRFEANRISCTKHKHLVTALFVNFLPFN